MDDSLSYDLGPSIAVYQGRVGTLLMYVILGGIVGLFSIVLIIMGIGLMLDGDSSAGVLIVLGLVLLGLGGLAIWLGISRRQRKIMLFEHGLVQDKGRKQIKIRWEDVKLVRFNNPSSSSLALGWFFLGIFGWLMAGGAKELSLEMNDGTKLKFGQEVGDIASLGRTVQSQVVALMKPRYLERLDSGQAVTIDSVKISSSKIEQERKSLAWYQVDRIQYVEKKNEILIYEKGKNRPWLKLNGNRMFNAYLVLELSREFVARERGGGILS